MRTQNGGGGEIRTRDPLLAKQMLYQLSYAPEIGGLCYKELLVLDIYFVRSTWEPVTPRPHRMDLDSDLPRKEVIQPHLPVRLPCYDFVPITDPTFDGCLLAVGPPASGVASFHDVTSGVYKPREHIHRRMLTGGY